MKHIELFKDGFDSTINDKIKLENWPYVGNDGVSGEIVYTLVPAPADPNTYVTFTAEEDNSTIGLEKLSTNQTLEYSTDTTTWNTFDKTTNISLNNEDKVYVRGMLSAVNTTSNYTQFKMTGKIAASGNCNAIWNYQDLNATLKARCGNRLFWKCTSLTAAPELPATTLAEGCYYQMFYQCASLTAAPELPATTLATDCYDSMFIECTSLTTAPEILPATTLAEECYSSMFKSCTSLVTAPELPATTLAPYCYYAMFSGCKSLIAPELPATTLAEGCYMWLFDHCDITAAPELPATSLANRCYYGMFRGCSSLTTSPELHVTTLTQECYYYMFWDCTKLNYIKCLATNISAKSCTNGWLYNVASTGTFIKHPNMSSWSTGNSGIPSGWTEINAEL